MAKQIVIDWARDGLLVANAQQRGSSVTIDKWSKQAVDGTAGKDAEASSSFVVALQRAVSELGLGKADVTIVASREVVEVRTLALPRMDAAELPDVIRFQAQRQFANMGDNWPLDYVLLPDVPGQETQTALVGVIAPSVLNEMSMACEKAGLQLGRVALRPLEIARYLQGVVPQVRRGSAVVACVSEQDADLIILQDGMVVQVRGTKLPTEAEQLEQTVRGEIKRSLMAASAQLQATPVTNAVLFSETDLASPAGAVMREVLGVDVAHLVPSQLLEDDSAASGDLARHAAARIAGIAGACGLATADIKTTINFLDPKKRPPPKSRRTQALLGTAAALLLAFAGISWWVTTNRALDEELAFYQEQYNNKEELETIALERIKDLEEIDQFLAASTNWLDELAYISTRIPPADKVLMGGPTFSATVDGSGQIQFPVAADSSATISEFERSLRDEQHIVRGRNIRQVEQPTELYKWQADQTMIVLDRGWDLLDNLSTARPQAESESPATAADAPAEPTSDDAELGSDNTASDDTRPASDDTASQTAAPTSDESVEQATPDESPPETLEDAQSDAPSEEPSEESEQPSPAAPVPDESKRASAAVPDEQLVSGSALAAGFLVSGSALAAGFLVSGSALALIIHGCRVVSSKQRIVVGLHSLMLMTGAHNAHHGCCCL